MRLKDLMEAPLIRDDDTVTLILEVKGVGTVKRKGSWYQDCIPDMRGPCIVSVAGEAGPLETDEGEE